MSSLPPPAPAAAACAGTSVAPGTAGTPLRLGPRLVHDQVAVAEKPPVQHLHRLEGLILGRHLHEPEASRAAGELVRDDAHGVHAAGLSEELAKILLGGLEREVSDKELSRHRATSCPRARGDWDTAEPAFLG